MLVLFYAYISVSNMTVKVFGLSAPSVLLWKEYRWFERIQEHFSPR